MANTEDRRRGFRFRWNQRRSHGPQQAKIQDVEGVDGVGNGTDVKTLFTFFLFWSRFLRF